MQNLSTGISVLIFPSLHPVALGLKGAKTFLFIYVTVIVLICYKIACLSLVCLGPFYSLLGPFFLLSLVYFMGPPLAFCENGKGRRPSSASLQRNIFSLIVHQIVHPLILVFGIEIFGNRCWPCYSSVILNSTGPIWTVFENYQASRPRVSLTVQLRAASICF